MVTKFYPLVNRFLSKFQYKKLRVFSILCRVILKQKLNIFHIEPKNYFQTLPLTVSWGSYSTLKYIWSYIWYTVESIGSIRAQEYYYDAFMKQMLSRNWVEQSEKILAFRCQVWRHVSWGQVDDEVESMIRCRLNIILYFMIHERKVQKNTKFHWLCNANTR